MYYPSEVPAIERPSSHNLNYRPDCPLSSFGGASSVSCYHFAVLVSVWGHGMSIVSKERNSKMDKRIIRGIGIQQRLSLELLIDTAMRSNLTLRKKSTALFLIAFHLNYSSFSSCLIVI